MATVDLIVEGNQDVSAAARQVLVAVRQGGSPDAATAALVRAAEASSTKVQGVVTQGLAAYETEGATGGAAADLVATALADLSQSNVLLAAGVALEGDADIDAESVGGLESALVELDRTTEALVEDASRHGGRLGFSADRLPPATPQHATVEGFRTAVATALDAIVDAAAQLAGAIVRVAGSLPADEVVGAAGTIGAQLAKPVSGLKRLLSIGLEKLRSAVNTLMKVLGEQRAAALRGWIAEQWEKLRSGQLLAGPIGVLLGTGATRQLADGIVTGPELTAERIEDASVRVASVTAQYGRTASQLEGHAGVLASAAKWGFVASKLLPVLGPWVTGAALAGYMALLGIGLLLAMDVADAGLDLGRVVGVRGIVTGLQA